MSVERNKILVVLGMHRSGTSAITRGLEVLGVNLGNHLMPAAKNNNEKGFFEDIDIHALNAQLLASQDSAWNQLSPIKLDQLLPPALLAKQEEAKRLLESKLQKNQVFAFKDPQTALLIPFWQRIFTSLNLDVRYLICFRNPLSVAASLHKRDGIYPAKAQLLWAKYLLSALRDTEGYPRLLIDYDSLMERPDSQLMRIAKTFDLPSPNANLHALETFSQEFLSPTLRHAIFNREHLTNSAQVLRQINELHVLLQSVAEDALDIQSSSFQANCMSLFEELSELQPVIREVDLLGMERLQLEDQLDEHARKMDALVVEHESGIGVLSNERDQLRTQLAMIQDECREAWSMHDKALKDKQELSCELLHNMQQNNELRSELSRILSSKSWRLLRPLRGLRRHYRNPRILLRALLSESARILWRALPGSTAQKQHFKVLAFKHCSLLLNKTKAYQNWQRMSSMPAAEPAHVIGRPLKLIKEPIQQVKKFQGVPPSELPARLIAYYLPQFHSIPENDEWWGEGFTEWTNVKPAQAQYKGHYQPHVPGDLDYYSLEDIDTQRRQVELAKLYGIGGFCFYFYWFGGKRLLESPIEQYLANADLDLPFCLCWANENWSRRWDGLDSQVLIGQSHSAEDDLAFIAYVSKYMRDARYIRIDGKPLLLVYRPSLLPDAKSTVVRWRNWCRENGIGEIYLAYTQSFEVAPPNKYGFDAAIEFPPNSTLPPDVTAKIEPLHNDFAGTVYDWSIYLKRSANYSQPPYKLFRGVCPSWDNTARRKTRGTSFVNSSPRGYQEWLFNAIKDTVNRQHNNDERLVFINAWNEWAEGAHLEPDQRYGYGFLEATRMANLRASLHLVPARTQPEKKLAVVIHAYYPDVFKEIVDHLSAITGVSLKLYISTTHGQSRALGKVLEHCPHEYVLEEMANHGRDLLPFLKMLPLVIADGFEYLVKIHTKKSTHRVDGDIWRQDLYDKVLTESSMLNALAAFESDSSLGILGPAGHLVPMNFYWGSNAATVEKLSCRLGVNPTELSALTFVAGTMFFANINAIRPLLNLALDDDDFEVEAGQVDGTFAHALERALSVSARSAGLSVYSTEGAQSNPKYTFAEATPA